MKIAIIGPGLMEIPPKGWGAVEILIHEYVTELKKSGWDVLLVNTRDRADIVRQVNAFAPDFVHCQYDEYIDVMPQIACKAKAITSHFGYLDQVWKFPDYLNGIHRKIVQDRDTLIFALSPSIAEAYRQDGVSPDRLFVVPNGVSIDQFRLTDRPQHADRSIYLAKVDYRKRQGKFQSYGAKIDFAGNLCPHSALSTGFDPGRADYLGEWRKADVYEKLTDYANLVLLSDGEAHPLVCMEAMAAGLGLVVSQYATANLDLTKPFIDVIPEDKIDDRDYVRKVIAENRVKSLAHRAEIRAYAETFAWPQIVRNYKTLIEKIVAQPPVTAPLSAKPRLAVVTIATGKYYDLFFRDFEKTLYQNLAPDCDTHIFCFTDYAQAPADARTSLVPARYLGWPFDTLLRYHWMKSILAQLMGFDFILYMDSDMAVERAIEPDILRSDLVAVEHPGFYKNRAAASFELDEAENAYVPFLKRHRYVQGCFWGGKPFAFKQLLLTLTGKIDIDLARGQIPVWHDESYLNWYLSSNAYRLLSPAYAYPEGWQLPFLPLVIHRDKNHEQARGGPQPGPSAQKIIDGLSLADQARYYRLLYLRAHEKAQRLERIVLRARYDSLALYRAWKWLSFRFFRLIVPTERGNATQIPDPMPPLSGAEATPPAHWTVDVVVPLYNNEKYVVEAVESALVQSFPVQKVIVVDDGSSDHSADRVEKHFANNPKVVLIRNGRHERSATRNAGIAGSAADFIAFLDSDDVWMPTKIERQLRVFAANADLGCVYCRYKIIDESGRDVSAAPLIAPRLRGYIFHDLLEGNFISGSASALIVKRDLFDKAGVFDESFTFGEDWDLWLRLARIARFDFIDDALTAIRHHACPTRTGTCYFKQLYRFSQHLRVWSKWPCEVSQNRAVLRDIRVNALRFYVQLILPHHSRVTVIKIVNKKIFSYLHPQILQAAFGGRLFLIVRNTWSFLRFNSRGFVRSPIAVTRAFLAGRFPWLRTMKRKITALAGNGR